MVLASVTEVLCADENIRQITVEDPAPAFQRLRDVVSIARAIRKGLLSRECLYPPEEVMAAANRKQQPSPANSRNWPQYNEVFKTLLFESPQQRNRLKLLLTVCHLLPTDLIDAVEHTQLGGQHLDSKRKKRRGENNGEANEKPSTDTTLSEWEKKNPQMTALRVQAKKRLRLESLDWYTQTRSLNEIQHELELEWTLLFKSLCGGIRTLRRQFPL